MKPFWGVDMAINYHDGESHLYQATYTDVHVVPADLAEFADLLDGDLKAIEDAWTLCMGELESGPPVNFTGEHLDGVGYPNGYPEVIYSGSNGFHEGIEFYRAYDRTLLAESALIRDLVKGLKVLRDAARMIHDDYLASDAGNAEGVEGAFAVYERSAVIEAVGQPDQGASGEDADRLV